LFVEERLQNAVRRHDEPECFARKREVPDVAPDELNARMQLGAFHAHARPREH
jgi:hypothetical protein